MTQDELTREIMNFDHQETEFINNYILPFYVMQPYGSYSSTYLGVISLATLFQYEFVTTRFCQLGILEIQAHPLPSPDVHGIRENYKITFSMYVKGPLGIDIMNMLLSLRNL